ncbi:MAG: flagellar assembly peptidoglycan hydrolase FlgJ [Gammaproteobacteria bacterium]
MISQLSTASVYTDFQGLAELRTAAREESSEALRAVAKEFEAIFMQMMLKSMRSANLGEGIFDSEQSGFYQEMFDKQIAIDLAQRQGVGLADVLVRQLSRSDSGAVTGVGETAAGRVAATVPFASPQDFVARLQEPAQASARRLGVTPEVLLAQAALESGWGRQVMRGPDGSSSHNLFGIKAGPDWQGGRVTATTLEYRNGVARKEQAVFRAYDSFAESFDDYADFLQGNPRYREALAQADDAHAYLQSLQDAGYATDPGYADKIGDILERDILAVRIRENSVS